MKKSNSFLASFIAVILGVSLGIVAYGLFFKKTETSAEKLKPYLEKKDLDITFGQDTAQLKIIIYGNYNCPHCRRFLLEEVPQLEKNYIETGKIQIIFRLTPQTNSPEILQSQKFAVCIHKFGQYQYIHQLLLNQPYIVFTNEFQDMINELIHKDYFVAECVMTSAADEYLTQNLSDLQQLNIHGTPAFIVGNNTYLGFKNHKYFSQLIDLALERAARK